VSLRAAGAAATTSTATMVAIPFTQRAPANIFRRGGSRTARARMCARLTAGCLVKLDPSAKRACAANRPSPRLLVTGHLPLPFLFVTRHMPLVTRHCFYHSSLLWPLGFAPVVR
jgi:hypothetical protein